MPTLSSTSKGVSRAAVMREFGFPGLDNLTGILAAENIN